MSNTPAKKTAAKKTAAKKPAAKKATAPAGAKIPSDRQASQEAEVLTLEASGFTLEIKPEVLDDFELIADLALIDDGDISRIPPALKRIAGPRYGEVLNHLRDPQTGRISMEVGSQFLADLMEGINPSS